MDRASFTLRLPKATRSALEGLSKIERRPVNQLVNDAVDLYLRQSGDAEKDLVATLDALNKYRASDPGYSKAMAAFVEAEAAGRRRRPGRGHCCRGRRRHRSGLTTKLSRRDTQCLIGTKTVLSFA